MMTDSFVQASTVATRFSGALDASLPALRRLAADELLEIDFEIPWGACLALEALPRIRAMRERLATLDGCGPFRLVCVDTLEADALAAAHAHARYLGLADPEQLLDVAVRRGHALQEILTANTRALAAHGVIEHAVAHAFQGHHGYQDIAAELLSLVELWNGVLQGLDGKTLVTPLHLIQAECHANQLLVGMASLGQEASPAQIAEAFDIRHRAFSAFASAYDSIRAALTFLCHHADSGTDVAPALSPKDQRIVRLAQIERIMTRVPREQWDPGLEAEFDRLYYRESK